MRYYLTSLICIFIAISCNNSTPSPSPERESLVDSTNRVTEESQPVPDEEKNEYYTRDISYLWKEAEDNMVRPTSFTFEGKLGDKHAIHLDITIGEAYKGGCHLVEGSYGYSKYKNSSIALKGEICPISKTIYLKYKKDGEIDEIFQGAIDSNLTKITGTWTKVATDKTLSFELQEISIKLPMELAEIYAKGLAKILDNDEAEGLSADNAGIDEKGLFIDHLQAWRPAVNYFSFNRFEGSTSYSSTARSSDTNVEIELFVWEKFNAVFIAEYMEWLGIEFTPSESEEDDDAEESEYIKSHLWHYHEGKWYDVAAVDEENKSPFDAKKEGAQLIIQKKGTQELLKKKLE